MKIYATVAEYNPLHLGHLKHIEYMKNFLHADKIIVLMSGNFTQRGEPAVLNKYKRAKQAVIAGADLVIELPTVFATANAETFACGAINVLHGLGVADGLCFGVESGEKQDYISLAYAMNNESKEFKKALKERLNLGEGFAKARFEAVKSLGGEYDESLISSPNNILGLEYTKALLKKDTLIDIFPMKREGDHNDVTLKKGVTSATSIRNVIKTARLKKLKKCLPPYVYQDLTPYPFAFDKMIMTKLITEPTENIKEISDCTEGLENRIKALSKDNRTVDQLVARASTKRYTAARIRRILVSNLLGITDDLVQDCLNSNLYAKVLAVSKDDKDLIAEISKKGTIPLITRKSDADSLKKTAAACFEKDVLANELYNLAADEKENEYLMLKV